MKLLENIFNKDRDETLVEFDKEVLKRKVSAPFKWVGKEVKKGFEWGKEHPAEAIMIGTTVVSGIYKGARLITRNREIRHDEFVRNCRHYDRKHDQWVTATRKLTNDEMAYMERKYEEGISKRKVLEDLGLLR